MTDIRAFSPLWGVWVPESKLGEGSFGSVWKVRRQSMDGQVYYAAVKHISIPRDESEVGRLLEEGILTDEASAVRYYNSMLQSLSGEIRTMHRLQGYTNIVSYEDHMVIPKRGGVGYDLFLRMELLTPLRERMRRGMTLEDILALGKDIATAIEVLNRHGLVHRDIKPQNIFVNETGDYKLGDYGTARALSNEATAMSTKGTFNYMAPEIYKNQKADSTVDIYSLGLVLYRLLNGNRLPFLPDHGDITGSMSDQAILRRIQGEPLPPPKYADPGLSGIVLKACAYEAKNRFQNGTQLREALERYQAGDVPEAPEPERSGGTVSDPYVYSFGGSAQQPKSSGAASGKPQADQRDPGAGREKTGSGRTGSRESEKKRLRRKARRRKRIALAAGILVLLLGLGLLGYSILKNPADSGTEPGGLVWKLFPALNGESDGSLLWRLFPFLKPESGKDAGSPGGQQGTGTDQADGSASGSGGNGPGTSGQDPVQESGTEEQRNPSEGLQTGDTVLFGRYEQNGDTADSQEDIEWIVLDLQPGKALLVSRYGLDARIYDPGSEVKSWGTCTLREWLNGEFLDSAFTSEEQEMILRSALDNSDLGTYGDGSIASAGNTEDRIFLLSLPEALRYLDSGNENCSPTAYAQAAYQAICNSEPENPGRWKNSLIYTDRERMNRSDDCCWWLRSPMSRSAVNWDCAFVADREVLQHARAGTAPEEYLDGIAQEMCMFPRFIRPAFWISLDAGSMEAVVQTAIPDGHPMADR